MFKKFDPKKLGITMILSLVLVTILSNLLSSFSNINVLKTGPAFILLFISTFLIYFFVAFSDGRIDKQEIWTMILIAIMLILSGWSLKHFFPQIFSAFPESTKQIFSAFGI
jgi:predicted tellurium resistance membrane protein TerC